MNAKQAHLLLPGEAVMRDGNPRISGIVVTTRWEGVGINWCDKQKTQYHLVNELENIEKWQPEAKK